MSMRREGEVREGEEREKEKRAQFLSLFCLGS